MLERTFNILEEAAKKTQEAFIAMAPDEHVTSTHSSHNMVFDAVDTNKDGHISVNEFKAYFQVIAPEISEAEVLHSFDTIDTNKNGEISSEEFLAAAVDFFAGLKKQNFQLYFLDECWTEERRFTLHLTVTVSTNVFLNRKLT